MPTHGIMVAAGDDASRSIAFTEFDAPELNEAPITLHTNPCAMHEVIELIGRNAGIDFVIDSAVAGNVGNLSFTERTPGQILRVLCTQHCPPLALVKRFDTWHVVPTDMACRLQRYDEPARLISRSFCINHIACDEALQARVEQFWTSLSADASTQHTYLAIDSTHKKIFARAPAYLLDEFASFLHEIDQDTPRVRIDAVVAVTNKTYEKNLGFNWSGIYNRQASANPSFDFIGLGGELTDFPTPEAGVSPENFAFHLFTKGANPINIPFVFGGTDLNKRRLNFVLNAAETDNTVKILLKPSVLTNHGESAEILIGQSIPITTFVEDVVEGKVRNVETVNFKDVGTMLHVVPFVSPDNQSVLLDILVEDSSTQEPFNAKNPPVITTIRTKNRVLLRNGQTTVIAGLMLKKNDHCKSRVPILHRLPIIGCMFRSSRKLETENELMIFITPTLIP